MATIRSQAVLLRVQRLVLATARTPLRHLWLLAYRAVAHAVGRYLTWAVPGAAVYTRASFGGGEFLPGLSDVDLAIVLATDEQADRVRARWQRHERVLSLTGMVDVRSSTGRRSCRRSPAARP